METASEKPLPHIGKLIHKIIREKGLSNAEVARRMNVSQQSMQHCVSHHSIQITNLFRLSIALNYNFLAEIMDKLPEEILSSSLSSFQQTIKTQQEEIENLKKEISVYKEILISK